MTDKIKKILIITLSNIGDVVLTFPAIDIILNDYPDASVDVVVGPKAKSILEGNPFFNEVIVYDKKEKPLAQLAWILSRAVKGYDLVIDFRQTAMPLFFLGSKRTPVFIRPKNVNHMRNKHIARLATIHKTDSRIKAKKALHLPPELDLTKLLPLRIIEQGYVVIAPGSASEEKCWDAKKFAELADHLFREHKMNTVIVGDNNDSLAVAKMVRHMGTIPLNLCGKTDLVALADVLKSSRLFIGNDSGIAHIASYIDVPVIALFGPHCPGKYGPWGTKGIAIRKNEICEKCRTGKKNIKHNCMENINVSDILDKLVIDGKSVVLN
jgi:ADP-heptose:LPS heptosyltransferase